MSWITLRRTLCGVVAVLCLFVGVSAGVTILRASRQAPLFGETPSGVADIGGDFSLIDHEGRRRQWSDFRGEPVALFFGFTNCPDICPTTLGELSTLLDGLGPQGDDLQVLLITGDPERDTPERLNEYLEPFDTQIIGLTGTEKEVDEAFSAFRAYRALVPLEDGEYTVDHSAGVYLFDRVGSFYGTLDVHETSEVKRQKIDRLLAG